MVLRTPRGECTLVVAASDAHRRSIAQAHFRCDGTDDNREIQAAIDALPSGGGRVRCTEGSFDIAETVKMNSPASVLQGMGQSTVFSMASGVTTMIKAENVGAQSSSEPGVMVKDMYLNGNFRAGNIGIWFNGAAWGAIENVLFDECRTVLKFTADGDSDRICNLNTVRNAKAFNCETLLYMEGTDATHLVTHNSFFDLIGWNIATQTPNMIDFVGWADTNWFYHTFITLNSNAKGVVYNSGDPTNNNEVYQNHFFGLSINQLASSTSIEVNKTERPSLVFWNTGGTNESAPVINTGGQIVQMPGSRINDDPVDRGVTPDPGEAGAIPVTFSGRVPLVTGGGGETRTLADAIAPGLTLDLYFKTDGSNCVVTSASPVNQTGNNTMTFEDVGDHIQLVSIEDGADFEWRVVANDGVALSTVA